MGWISVPPEVIDRALAVVVDTQRGAVAVWKGRSRIDVYDLGGRWQQTSRPYPREEEGLWSRTDVLTQAQRALIDAAPLRREPADTGDGLRVDVEALGAARLVRASDCGYALWGGGDAVDVYSPDARHLRWIHVDEHDVSRLSQRMVDLLSEAVGVSIA
ncbi:MAG: hypothetical protein ACYDA2_10030 [Acidimicrobiales bacterium]